jgi:hypothetical protein
MDITESYLVKKYNEMLDTTYDFSCLFLSHYTSEQQQEIKNSGNFWLRKLADLKEDYYVFEPTS